LAPETSTIGADDIKDDSKMTFFSRFVSYGRAGMINPLGVGNKRQIESVSGGAAAGGSMSVASDGKAKCAPTAAVVKRQKEEKKAEEIKVGDTSWRKKEK
jgi:hypothetical protein